MKFIKENIGLILILGVAFLSRLPGLFYGYPLALGADETPTVLAALKMIGTLSWRATATGYYYPALLAYVYLPPIGLFLLLGLVLGFFPDIAAIKETVFLNFGVFIPLARFLSLLFGLASIWLVYKISQRIFSNKIVSCLAAWFLAINFIQAVESSLANTWSAQTFFILFFLWWAIGFFQKNRVVGRDYLWGALVLAGAFGINVVGILAGWWFVAAQYLKEKRPKIIGGFLRNKYFWLFCLTFILLAGVIYYLNPAGLNNYAGRVSDAAEPVKDIGAILNDQGAGTYKPFTVNTLYIFWFYVVTLFTTDPVIILLAILGTWYLWRRARNYFYLLAPWPLIYLVMLSPLTRPNGRYALPVVPILAILAAVGANEIWQRLGAKKRLAPALLLLVSVYSLVLSGALIMRLQKSDSRVLARNWILGNIPGGAAINNIDLGGSLYLVENKKSLELIKEKAPDLFSSKRNYLLSLAADKYPEPGYDLIEYPALLPFAPDAQYIILSEFDYQPLRAKREQVLSGKLNLVKSFYPVDRPEQAAILPGPRELQVPYYVPVFNLVSLFSRYNFYGPYIEIYQLK